MGPLTKDYVDFEAAKAAEWEEDEQDGEDQGSTHQDSAERGGDASQFSQLEQVPNNRSVLQNATQNSYIGLPETMSHFPGEGPVPRLRHGSQYVLASSNGQFASQGSIDNRPGTSTTHQDKTSAGHLEDKKEQLGVVDGVVDQSAQASSGHDIHKNRQTKFQTAPSTLAYNGMDFSINRYSKAPARGGMHSSVGSRAPVNAGHTQGLQSRRHPYRNFSTNGLTNGTGRLTTAGERNFSKSKGAVPDQVQQTAEQKRNHQVSAMKFLAQPRAGEKFAVQLYYQVDEDSNEILQDNMQELDEIRKGHAAYISHDTRLQCLRVQAHKQQDPSRIMSAIRTKFKELGTTSGSTKKFLIFPASPEKFRPMIKAASLDPVRVTMTGHALTGEPLSQYRLTSARRIAENNEQLRDQLKVKFEELQFEKQTLNMYVEYGTLGLDNFKKALTSAEGQKYVEFLQMMGSNKCKGTFSKDLGSTAFAKAVIECIVNVGDSQFTPPEYSYAEQLKDVLPEHMLIFSVRNGNGNLLRFETKLVMRHDGTYSSSQATIFLGSKQKRFNSSTLFIGQKFDTCHEIVIDTPLVPDQAMMSFLKRIGNAPITVQIDQNGDDVPRVSLDLKSSFRPGDAHEALDGGFIIQNVGLRTSTAFGLTSSGYEVSVNTYRTWAGHKTNVEPASTQCGVRFYNPTWDLLMKDSDANGKHKWDTDLKVVFPDVCTGAAKVEGFAFFLKKVRFVRDLLEKASGAI